MPCMLTAGPQSTRLPSGLSPGLSPSLGRYAALHTREVAGSKPAAPIACLPRLIATRRDRLPGMPCNAPTSCDLPRQVATTHPERVRSDCVAAGAGLRSTARKRRAVPVGLPPAAGRNASRVTPDQRTCDGVPAVRADHRCYLGDRPGAEKAADEPRTHAVARFTDALTPRAAPAQLDRSRVQVLCHPLVPACRMSARMQGFAQVQALGLRNRHGAADVRFRDGDAAVVVSARAGCPLRHAVQEREMHPLGRPHTQPSVGKPRVGHFVQ